MELYSTSPLLDPAVLDLFVDLLVGLDLSPVPVVLAPVAYVLAVLVLVAGVVEDVLIFAGAAVPTLEKEAVGVAAAAVAVAVSAAVVVAAEEYRLLADNSVGTCEG